MKFLHLADLHLGKTINGINLIESGDQVHWVEELLKLVQSVSPDAVVIAGDVYDSVSPRESAVELLDRMLTAIADLNIPVLMIAGNHDSGPRLSFGHSLLARQNIHIAGVPAREMVHVTVKGVTFWLMPYLFPLAVSQLLGDEEIRTYDDAAARLLAEQDIDFSKRNVLVAHQNVVAGGQEVPSGGSESMVGGVGKIEYTVFDGFDYVALGHIHSSYCVGRDAVRYAGTPLCYHFNETRQPEKGPLFVEIPDNGGEPVITRCFIAPVHPMREVVGTWDELVKDAETTPRRGEYLRIVVTDRKIDPVSMDNLRSMYRLHGSIIMENNSTWQAFTDAAALHGASAEQEPLEELFAGFYRSRNAGSDPSDADMELFRFLGEIVRNTPDTELDEKNADIPGEQYLTRVREFMNRQEAQA